MTSLQHYLDVICCTFQPITQRRNITFKAIYISISNTVIVYLTIHSNTHPGILKIVFAKQMEEKVEPKYAEVPQDEQTTAKGKEPTEDGPIRLQAKMSLLNGNNR